MTEVITEKEFCLNFLQLMNVSSEVKFANDYKEDLRLLKTLGPSLPKLSTPKKSRLVSENELVKSLRLNFKSIKPPKFNISLDTTINNTIFKIKEQLLEKASELAHSNVSSLKLLVKGKVIPDSTILGSLINENDKELSFMVMVSNTTKSQSSTPEPESILSDPTPLKEINDRTWGKINEVLNEEYGTAIATEALERFKKGWKLAV